MRIYPVFLQNAGCPHHCLFCNQTRLVSPAQSGSPDEVAAYLDKILPEQGDGEVAFYGGSFTLLELANQQAFLTTARQFVSQGRVQGVRLSTRPDALSDAVVDMLASYDVTTVEIGCQSFDDQVLQQARRGHTGDQNKDAVSRCLAAGFQVGVQLMPGLPGGTSLEALASVRQALELNPDFLRIYPALVVSGTEMADLWRSGSFTPWTLDQAVDICADMLLLCRNAKIPVIRMGLQQDERLRENLLAGPYHPAFGQLVRSRLWRRAISSLSTQETVICVNPVDFSDALGHAGENRKWFSQHVRHITLTGDHAVLPGYFKTADRELSMTQLLSSGGENE